jgi:hypothetical protein
MARCPAPKIRGSTTCGGELNPRESDDLYLCITCRRLYTAQEIIVIERKDAYDDMMAAQKEQEQIAAREERKKAARGRGRTFA